MNYDTQLIESIVFFAMEYLDELEIPADFFMHESGARISTEHQQFFITKDTSADYIKYEIDSIYKAHMMPAGWVLKHASLDEVKEVYL